VGKKKYIEHFSGFRGLIFNWGVVEELFYIPIYFFQFTNVLKGLTGNDCFGNFRRSLKQHVHLSLYFSICIVYDWEEHLTKSMRPWCLKISYQPCEDLTFINACWNLSVLLRIRIQFYWIITQLCHSHFISLFVLTLP
jgi:hypothetical protein